MRPLRPLRLAAPDVSFAPGEAVAYFLLAVALDIVMGLPMLPQVLGGALLNPDSYMRLVRLQDSLAQHTLVDRVLRDGSGAGTVVHWSHLLDGALLLLAAPPHLFLDQRQALFWAAAALGPVGLGLLGAALAWVLAPLSARRWRWSAPVLAATSLPIIGYALPGVAHHHIALALAVTMAAGWALRTPTAGPTAGWHLGLWAAVGIWLSPETMPFLLLIWSGLGLAWLLHPRQAAFGAALRTSGSGFLLLTAAAFALDPPQDGYAGTEIDRLSLVYLALALAVCAIGWMLAGLDRRAISPVRRGSLGVLVAVIGIGVWLALFPRVRLGPGGLMDANDAREFFGVITEMQPVTSLAAALRELATGALATAALLALAIRTRSPLWGYGALCGGIALVLGVMHVRFATYPAAFAAAALPMILTRGSAAALHHARKFALPGALAVLAVFLIGPHLGDSAAALAARRPPAPPLPSCSVRHIAPLLAPYAGKVVLADVNDTPELLYRTRVLTVGSLYHENVAAFRRLRAAWRSQPGDAEPAAVKATGAALVLFCPHAARSPLVADLPPETLWDRLNRAAPPGWLTEVGRDKGSGNVLYRIGGTAAAVAR